MKPISGSKKKLYFTNFPELKKLRKRYNILGVKFYMCHCF
jgi:hypothetical protein